MAEEKMMDKLYFTVKEQTIKYQRMGQPFTYPYRLAIQGKKMYKVPVWKSFWAGTNAGLDHYRSTKQLFPKHAMFNSGRHAANKTLDYIMEHMDDKTLPWEDEE